MATVVKTHEFVAPNGNAEQRRYTFDWPDGTPSPALVNVLTDGDCDVLVGDGTVDAASGSPVTLQGQAGSLIIYENQDIKKWRSGTALSHISIQNTSGGRVILQLLVP